MPADDGVREVDLDWRSVAAVLAAFVGLVAVTGVVRAAPRTVTAVMIASLLALALSPLVALAQRLLGDWAPRGIAVGSVLAVFTVVAAGILLLLAPPALRQARDLHREVPVAVDQLGDLPFVGDNLRDADVPAKVQAWIEALPDRVSGDTTPLEQAGRSIADGLVAAVATGLLAVTLLLDGPRLATAARRAIPERRRRQADRLGGLAYAVVGRYVAGSLTVAGVAGLSVLGAGLVLGVPLTPLAALWVALWDLVPQIGGAMGGIPFVLLAFTQGAGTGVAAAAFFVVYLQIENHVVAPLLVGQAVKLSPPATMTAALIGVSAGGVVGALLAVPLVGAAKAVYMELRGPAVAAPEE